MNRLQVIDLPVDRVGAEVAAVLFFEEDRPLVDGAALLDWRLNGLLTDLLLSGRASGREGENILVRSNGKVEADWILFIGGGRRENLDEDRLGDLLRRCLQTCINAGFSRLCLGLALLPGTPRRNLEAVCTTILRSLHDRELDCCIAFVRNANTEAAFA